MKRGRTEEEVGMIGNQKRKKGNKRNERTKIEGERKREHM